MSWYDFLNCRVASHILPHMWLCSLPGGDVFQPEFLLCFTFFCSFFFSLRLIWWGCVSVFSSTYRLTTDMPCCDIIQLYGRRHAVFKGTVSVFSICFIIKKKWKYNFDTTGPLKSSGLLFYSNMWQPIMHTRLLYTTPTLQAHLHLVAFDSWGFYMRNSSCEVDRELKKRWENIEYALSEWGFKSCFHWKAPSHSSSPHMQVWTSDQQDDASINPTYLQPAAHILIFNSRLLSWTQWFPSCFMKSASKDAAFLTIRYGCYSKLWCV